MNKKRIVFFACVLSAIILFSILLIIDKYKKNHVNNNSKFENSIKYEIKE